MRFLRGILGAITMLLTMVVGSAFGQELTLIADYLHPEGLNIQPPLKLAPNGDIYALYGASGISRITGPSEAEQIFIISGPDSLITVSDQRGGVTQTSISLDRIYDYEVDINGTLYIGGVRTNNVVRIGKNGTVDEIINGSGDGKGNIPRGSINLALDLNGDLFVVGTESRNIFKIDQKGEITLILDESGVGSRSLKPPFSIFVDSSNNKFVSSLNAFFIIPPSGEAEVYLDTQLDEYSIPVTEDFLVDFKADDFGNLYFVKLYDSSSLYRFSPDGVLERILGPEGDGTGEFECVSTTGGGFDIPICTGYGNYLRSIVGIHIDAAQNIYAVGRTSRNVFRVTPSGQVSEVADLGAIENFNFEAVYDFDIDASGNFYLLHKKGIGQQNSIFSYSPLSVEQQNDFSIQVPHSEIIHNATGVANLPSSYTLTNFSQEDALPDAIAHMDTRTAAFSALPWQEGTVTTQGGEGSGSKTIRTSLSHEGHLYEAQMKIALDSTSGREIVNSISYTVDGVQRYLLSGLELPLEIYSHYMNQSLMSWIYLGNDVIIGGPRADILLGYEGHDILYGNDGDDLLDGSSGANIYYGGEGFDTVVYERRRADYMLSKNPVNGFVSVQAKTGQGSPYIDLVAPDTERLRFSDGEIDTAQLHYWGELKSVESVNLAAPPVNVYRFFNTQDNAFFYSTNPDERTMVLRNSGPNNKNEVDWPYVYQGAKFQVAHTYPGAVPLYRFYNTQTGHHFFTINEDERAHILAQIRDAGWPFVDEGIAFEVYADDPTPFELGNEWAVYRYYSWSLNRHLFTSSEEEAAMLDISSEWSYEGIGFYAEALQ